MEGFLFGPTFLALFAIAKGLRFGYIAFSPGAGLGGGLNDSPISFACSFSSFNMEGSSFLGFGCFSAIQ